MNDLISRQAAIDAVAEFLYYTSNFDGMQQGFDLSDWKWKMEGVLSDLPSAQPEITRCKGCKHQVKEWRTDKRLKDKGYMVCGCEVVGDACGYWALLGQDDDYCSFAERREDERSD